MDETVEEDVIEEIKEQIIEKPETPNGITESEFIAEGKGKEKGQGQGQAVQGLSFNDVDSVMHKSGKEEMVNAPKSIERLEEISNLRAIQRKMEEADDDMLNISDENVELNGLDVHVIGGGDMKLNNDFLLNDIEVLA
jgi:hypothetical protein